MDNWIMRVLNDSAGQPSSKRMTGFVALIMFVYVILMNTLKGVIVDYEVWAAIVSIIFWTVGMSSTEKKIPKDNNKV